MLPIDELTPQAAALCRDKGIDPTAFYAVLLLDMTPGGGRGETLLALDGAGELLRILPQEQTIERWSLGTYSHPYIDSLLSANRLLLRIAPPGVEEEGEPLLLGLCTNACKSRLFVFLQVLLRRSRGELVGEEDRLFDDLLRRCPQCGARLGKKETCACTKKEGRVKPVLRTMALFCPPTRVLLLTLFCLAVELTVDLIRPYLSGKILFDEILVPTGRWHALGPLFLCLSAIVGLAVLRWCFIIIRNVAREKSSKEVSLRLKGELFRAVTDLSLSYYNRHNTASLSSLINADVANVRTFVVTRVVSLIIYLVEFVVALAILFRMNVGLSLLILIPVPFLLLIYRRAFPKLKQMNTRAYHENVALSSRINSSLDGIRVVKAFSKEREEAESLTGRLARLYRVNLQANLLSALLGPAVTLLIYLADQAVWGIGGLRVMGGEMTYGEFSVYLGYVGMVFAPLQFFSDFALYLGQMSESAKRMADTLAAKSDLPVSPTPLTPERVRGAIAFEDVSFHYKQNRPILKRMSFEIEAGDHVGLVGRTGSGKSTMANLITRMYDPTGGVIRLDGVDLRELSPTALRRNVAIISQEIYLFRGTVADNLRFGRPEATMAEVIAAAKAAHAHDFILALPHGYETLIGLGRRALSGGERQRLSIARALLTDPAILILDEATAAMDNETERGIAASLATLCRGKTTLSIAHRLSSLRDCNKIMAIENGELREMGSKRELLEQKGIYYKLYTLQNEQMMAVLEGREERV